MITCITFVNVLFFVGTLQLLTATLDTVRIVKQRALCKELNLEELLRDNSTLYTHEDCPLIKEKGLACPKKIRTRENTIVDAFGGGNEPIRHYCATLVERDKPPFYFNNNGTLVPFEANKAQQVNRVCPKCVYAIMLPTKYLPHLQKYTSDPRCNYTLPQHVYRQKNNKSFKLRAR